MRLDENSIGSKAYSLHSLKSRFLVPKFLVIPEDRISSVLKSNKVLEDDIKNAFNGTQKDRLLLRKRVRSCVFKLNAALLRGFSKKLIVRSSAIGEDGATYSFAGIYESKKVQNDPKELERVILDVVSSAYSEKVHRYLKNVQLKSFPKISIFVQSYVDFEYSGVAFTSTYFKNKKGVLTNAVRGSAEKAVGGIDTHQIFFAPGEPEQTFLPKKVLPKLIKLCRDLENHTGKPQDVEWGFSNNRLYLLQTRPITKDVGKELQVWDNSNIAESYSGIVLPLTTSFVKMIYSRVYRDVARNSRIREKKIRENSILFDNLLGFFYGKIYYNILNWYKMLTLFPGYSRNKRNLDDMISAKNRSELNDSYRKNVNFFDKFVYYANLIKRLILFKGDVGNFKIFVDSYLKKVNMLDLEELSSKKIWNLFENYKSNLLSRWSITVDNDFLAMTWFGLYKKQSVKLGLNNEQILSNIASMNSLISSEQVSSLDRIAEIFKKDKYLVDLAKGKKWKKCSQGIYSNILLRGEIEKYLKTYGGRFANELKLESKDIDSDPTHLVKLLFAYTNNKKILNPQNNKMTKGNSPKLNYYARKTKYYLQMREELRLLRSCAFSYTRKLFVALGKKFEKNNIVDNYDDIFYLELGEIKEIVENKSIDVKGIIAKRKSDYKKYEKIELENVIFTHGNETPPPIAQEKTSNTKLLRGVGCSYGTVQGNVEVMREFKIPRKKMGIIVVKHTDPGWTPIFGLCKGLIVENGGLLSHAAIISRELNLPCIIGVKNATKILKNNQKVKMDGARGIIEIG